MKRLIFFFTLGMILLCQGQQTSGQVSLSYQYSSLNKFGIGYDFTPQIRSELRLYSNTYIGDITPELVFMFNLKTRDTHEIYAGVGGVMNYFNGILVPAGIRVRPFENLRGLAFVIELEPTYDFDMEDILIQSSAGIRYTFGRKK